LNELSARVTSNAEIMPGVCLVWLEAPAIAAAAKPGQFIMVRCGEELLLRRPFSIHQVSDTNKLAILFSVVGKGTQWLAQCKVGDRVDLLGPLGNGFTMPDKAQHILLVAGGIGIAPLVFLADEALGQENTVSLLMGATSNIRLFRQQKSQIVKGLRLDGLIPPKVMVYQVTEDGSAGEKGLVTDVLMNKVKYGISTHIYACGPLPMYKTMAQMPVLKDKHVQVSLEVTMGCGVGVCYGCTVKTRQGLKQVCQDGPVFNLHDILWDELNW